MNGKEIINLCIEKKQVAHPGGYEDRKEKFMKNFELKNSYKVTDTFEISVDYNGFNYLIVFGHHVNGWFISVFNWQVGTEAAAPEDVFYNTERLAVVLENVDVGKALAEAIYVYWKTL